MIGPEARRAVGLILRLECSHPTLTGAVLGGTLLPPGPLVPVAGRRLVPGPPGLARPALVGAGPEPATRP
jgi:hypothetical protein